MNNILYLILSALLLTSCGNEEHAPRGSAAEDTPPKHIKQPAPAQDDFGKALNANAKMSADEAAKYFVDAKNINKRDAGTGETPLMAAARCNNLPVLKYLLHKGAQPNDVYQNPDQGMDGYPALWHAVNWNNAAMVKALLDAGANPRLGPTTGFGPIVHEFAEGDASNDALEELLKADKTLANWKLWAGTPLHRAANSRKFKTVKLLLRYGADKTITDGDGRTPWDWLDPETKKLIPELKP